MYVSEEELKKTLSLANETFADDDIAIALGAASGVIDRETGRTFGMTEDSESPEARRFTETEDGLVPVDDLVVLDSITVDGDEWDLADVDLLPVNAATRSEPYTYLSMPGLPRGADIEVTGTYGWPEVPAEVKQATSILASRLLKRGREAPLGVASFGMDGGAIRVSRSDPDVAMLIRDLRRRSGGSVALD